MSTLKRKAIDDVFTKPSVLTNIHAETTLKLKINSIKKKKKSIRKESKLKRKFLIDNCIAYD
jgi:hypothetical protein